MFVGQALSVGAVVSNTCTVKVHGADMLLARSVALQLTVVVPSGKLLPEAGVQVTVAVPQLSEAVGGVKLTVAIQFAPATWLVMFAGQVPSVGSCVSLTVTEKLQFASGKTPLLAVQTTFDVPTGKLCGDVIVVRPIRQVTVGVGKPLAAALNETDAVHCPDVALTVWLVGQAVNIGVALLVNEKLIVGVAPLEVAVTLYVPPVPFAVTVPVVARPPEMVAGLPAMLALAPLMGGMKVTVPPLTGSPMPFAVTFTESRLAKAVLTSVV